MVKKQFSRQKNSGNINDIGSNKPISFRSKESIKKILNPGFEFEGFKILYRRDGNIFDEKAKLQYMVYDSNYNLGIKKWFFSEENALKYMKENNLSLEDYFIGFPIPNVDDKGRIFSMKDSGMVSIYKINKINYNYYKNLDVRSR